MILVEHWVDLNLNLSRSQDGWYDLSSNHSFCKGVLGLNSYFPHARLSSKVEFELDFSSLLHLIALNLSNLTMTSKI